MELEFILAQVFGLFGLICSVLSMQMKKRRDILIFLAGLNIFAGISMLYLHRPSGALINFFAVVEIFINYQYEKRRKPVPKMVVATYITTNLLLGIIPYSDIIDILPIVNSVIFCGTILAKREKDIRRLNLVNQMIWLVYNVNVMAYLFIISNVMTIVSISVAMWRYDFWGRKKRNRKKK